MLRTSVLALALASVSMASAQNFNLDFGTGTAGFGVPTNTYGAAAGQAGVWHSIGSLLANTPVALNGLNGAATAAALSSTTAQPSFAFNNTLTTGDDEALLDDQFDLGPVNGIDSFSITGLANGVYDVYVYAIASDSAASRMTITLGSQSQVSGGTYAGLQEGVTHVRFSNVAIGNGVLNFTTVNTVGFGSLNGMQIVAVPEPATLAALGLGGLLVARRRRK